MTRSAQSHYALSVPALLGLALATGACSKTEPPAPSAPASSVSTTASAPLTGSASAAAPTPPVPRAPRNVLLITIDSLRADMPWAGYPRAIAPNLTKLAEESVVYERAYSLSSYTSKSVAGFLTGHYPSTLYRSGNFFAVYPKSDLFLAEVLQTHGVATTGWHAHFYFGTAGFDQGFQTWQLVPGIQTDYQTDNSITSDKMTELGIQLLGKPESTGKQFFAWAHYMDPHDKYQKHTESPDFGNKSRDKYDNEVFYADLWIGKLLDFARSQPWWKDTVLIVSADHGEAFGEHDFYKHAFEVWDVLTHVPMLVSGPGIKPRRISERRSHIDLAPTVLDVMGLPPEPTFMGKSTLPELEGGTPDNREPIITELTEDSHNPPRRAILVGDYKLIVIKERKFQLFNLTTDPGEMKDLAASEPAKLDEMKQIYTQAYAKLPLLEPYGGNTLKEGGSARGPRGPQGE